MCARAWARVHKHTWTHHVHNYGLPPSGQFSTWPTPASIAVHVSKPEQGFSLASRRPSYGSTSQFPFLGWKRTFLIPGDTHINNIRNVITTPAEKPLSQSILLCRWGQVPRTWWEAPRTKSRMKSRILSRVPTSSATSRGRTQSRHCFPLALPNISTYWKGTRERESTAKTLDSWNVYLLWIISFQILWGEGIHTHTLSHPSSPPQKQGGLPWMSTSLGI